MELEEAIERTLPFEYSGHKVVTVLKYDHHTNEINCYGRPVSEEFVRNRLKKNLPIHIPIYAEKVNYIEGNYVDENKQITRVSGEEFGIQEEGFVWLVDMVLIKDAFHFPIRDNIPKVKPKPIEPPKLSE